MIYKYIRNSPLKTKLLIFFLPIIIISVLLTGLFSYISAVGQLQKNAYYLLNDTIYQTSTYLDEKFLTMFEQLVTIENEPAFQNYIFSDYDSKFQSNRSTDFIKLNNLLNQIYQRYFQVIDSMYLSSSKGREIQLLRDSIPTKVGVDLNEYFGKYNGSVNGYYWINEHVDSVFSTTDKRHVLTMLKLIGAKQSETKGILLINLKSQYIMKILQNVRVSPNGYLALVSQDNVIFSKDVSEKNLIGDVGIDFLKKNIGNRGSFNLVKNNGEKSFVVFNTIGINRWAIAAIVPEKDIIENAGQIKYISFAIVIVLIFISTILATIFAGSMSNSLLYLSRQVKLFEKGDFNVKFEIRDENEIGVLAKGLSSLLNTVKNLLEKIKDEQERKRQIELLALQSQINPHFLYNTLGSIKHLIVMNENPRAEKMVSALTKFFMIGISKGKEIIIVEEEIEHVRSYLTIQKMRYSKDFDYSFEVSEEILKCKIIKLTLQPIVENSIYHGIKNNRKEGIIKIKGWRQENSVILEVEDNGPGIKTERLIQLEKSINLPEVEENPITFGLRNVNQRIKLHFGIAYGITIQSDVNIVTKIRITIPFD